MPKKDIVHWINMTGVPCGESKGEITPYMSAVTCPECAKAVQAQIDQVLRAEIKHQRFKVVEKWRGQ